MLSTNVAGIHMNSCVWNASGPRCGTIEAIRNIGHSSAGAIVSKSATSMENHGNPLPRFVNNINIGEHCMGSLNSEGLPNKGIDYCKYNE